MPGTVALFNDLEQTHGVRPSLQSVSVLRGGTQIEIRPIQPEDEERMIRFHEGLSERSVYMRYFESLSLAARTAHARLSRICFVDPEKEIVLVALSDGEIVGVGRLNRVENTQTVEFAVLVLDKFQGRGIGTQMLRQLLHAARDQNITQIEADILRDNTAMQRVLKNSSFHLRLLDPRSVRAVLAL